MERSFMPYGLRERLAQLVSGLFGSAQQQYQQFQRDQSDRQIFDGYSRSGDDPDTRQRTQQAFAVADTTVQNQPGVTPGQADVLAAARQSVEASRVVFREAQRSTPDTTAGLSDLAARVQVVQQALVTQQQARQRGQGMGW